MSLGAVELNSLIFLCACWVVVALVLALDLSKRKPLGSSSSRWGRTGVLVMITGPILSQFAEYRHWPRSQQLALDTMTLVLVVAGFASVIVGITILRRSQRVVRPRVPPTD